MDDSYSDCEIYCSQLLRRQRGFPLYDPSPRQTLPMEYQRSGVAIGDVSRINSEGSFDFFFNIYLPADDPINQKVPKNFRPLMQYDSGEVYGNLYYPGCHVSTSSVQKLGSYVFPEGDFLFSCDAPQGAVLALPHGSQLPKLENIQALQTYAATHAESWFEHATSWGIASFHSVNSVFQLSFKPTTEVNHYRWSDNRGQDKYYDPLMADKAPGNQTMFIHGFSSSLRTGILAGLLSTVQIHENAYTDSELGSTACLWEEQHLIFHPGELINNYILEKAPEARVVMSHDDNWCDILGDDDPESPIQTVLELLQRISEQYEIAEKDDQLWIFFFSPHFN
ncbi:hypothetical protein B0H14DRAFT_2650288 [Mycena olivaceomarginata]|nr:hypothetical protein B0H14DRAFT_2650288 [Mycena olivaceomarginata]